MRYRGRKENDELLSMQRFLEEMKRDYPLHFACLFDPLEELQKIVYSGRFFIDCVDEKGRTPLGLLAMELYLERAMVINHIGFNDYEEKIMFLLKNGADPLKRWNRTDTIADMLFRGKNKNIINMALEYITDINAPLNAAGQTPLALAIRKGYYKIAERLLAVRKADINSGGYFATSPIFCATVFQSPQFMNMLIKHGGSLYIMNIEGETPLHVACYNSRNKNMILKCLQVAPLSLHHRDADGITPLHRLVSQSANKPWAAEMVEIFIDRGCELNPKDFLGRTPLRISLARKFDDVSTVLLRNGAHLDITNKELLLFIPRHASGSCQASQIFLKYLAVENAKGISIFQEALERLAKQPLASSYMAECYDEINRIIPYKIKNTTVTYWDLMTKSIKQIALYANNPDIIQEMESFDIDSFPIYGPEILHRFSRGKRRLNFMMLCTEALNTMCEGKLPSLFTDMVIDRLSLEDMRNVKNAVKIPI